MAERCADASEERFVKAVSRIRSLSGERPLACHETLHGMARDHALNLAATEDLGQTDGHAELPGTPHFTGATLGERADAHGFEERRFWLAEGVGGGSDADAVLAAHLATVYHRSPLLAPSGTHVAFALEKGEAFHAVINSMASVAADNLVVAVYPYDGMPDAACAFGAGGERPRPVPDVVTPGFPVSAHVPRFWRGPNAEEPALEVEAFTLVDGRGAPVPSRLLTRATDAEVYPSDAYLIPLKSLQPNQRYEARVRLLYDGRRVERAWSFTTGSKP